MLKVHKFLSQLRRKDGWGGIAVEELAVYFSSMAWSGPSDDPEVWLEWMRARVDQRLQQIFSDALPWPERYEGWEDPGIKG